MPIAFKAIPGHRGLTRGAQATAFAVWVIPDLFDEALMALDTELNDDINQQVQELLDIGAREFLSRSTLFNEKHQLLEREFSARRVDARDGAWVAAIDVP
jgi:hypothetical protein